MQNQLLQQQHAELLVSACQHHTPEHNNLQPMLIAVRFLVEFLPIEFRMYVNHIAIVDAEMLDETL